MTTETSLDEARGPIHDAQVALTKAVWQCIVDASSMNVVMSGSEYNAAVRAFRRAIEAAIRAESEAKAAALREGIRLAQVEVSEAAWSLGREHELFDRLMMAVTRLAALTEESER